MTRYGGDDIGAFAKAIEAEAPSNIRDWSIDLAYHLAMALISLNKISEAGVQTTYRRKQLVEPALQDAWRQLVFIRQRYIPDEIALNDIIRQVTLSRTGRILLNDSPDTDTTGRHESNSGIESKIRQRLYRRGDTKRYRRRITRKPTSN